MGTVTVFVDDAVSGRLPSVCVHEGTRTADRLTVRIPVGGSRIGAAWLLVFFGPIGWLALGIVALTTSGEVLSVTLPCSEQAYRRRRQLRRAEMAAMAAMVVLVVFEILVFATRPPLGGLWALLLAVGILASLSYVLASAMRLTRSEVRVSLDGSRRWVTVANAHPAFVFAAWEQVHFQQALERPGPVG